MSLNARSTQRFDSRELVFRLDAIDGTVESHVRTERQK